MAGGGALIVAPWGDPSGWRLVEYRLEGGGAGVRSFTSLEAVAGVEGGDALVLALDTLARPRAGAAWPPGGYADLLGVVEGFVRGFLCGLGAEVEVLPGAIRTPSLRARGRIFDYYVLALHAVLSRLLGRGYGRVAVDSTHGINFMPMLTYRAAREAAALASLASQDGVVELRVYNSDPVVPPRPRRGERDPCMRSQEDPCKPADPGRCEPQETVVRLAVKERLTPLHALAFMDQVLGEARGGRRLPALRPVGRPDGWIVELRRRVEREVGGTVEAALRLLRLARHGLAPLLAVRASGAEGDPDRYRRAFEAVAEAWGQARVVEYDAGSGVLVVSSRLSFDSGAVALLYAWAVAGAAWDALGGGGPTLEGVWRLAGRLYQGTSALRIVQERERSKLNNALEKTACTPGRLELSALYTDAPARQGLTGCDVFKRDLLAHGGWHTDVIVLDVACKPGGRVDRARTRVGVREAPVCREGREPRSVWEVVDGL